MYRSDAQGEQDIFNEPNGLAEIWSVKRGEGENEAGWKQRADRL